MGNTPPPRELRTTVALPSAEGPYSLTIYGPDRPAWTVSLEPNRTYRLGRTASADIRIDYAWVSERHATIVGGDPPYIVDAGSRNGTVVDGRPLRRGESVPLPVGSTITIGRVSLVVQRGEETTSAVFPLAAAVQASEPGAQRARRTRQHSIERVPFVTDDPRMRELYAFAREVAASRVNVLILGETGVGKELLAQAIHDSSPRSASSLVVLNCAAIPENLVESELFGYERGAFSGAVTAKPGLFETADGSTFFLDEIGELPLTVQPKLLRVLETGEVTRLGSVRRSRVDVRVVAATNRDLQREIAAGGFRADLFYRLNGISMSIPPLRERRADIVALAKHFAERSRHRAKLDFTPAALAALSAHEWPGNVRELRAVVERAALLARGGPIDAPHLQFDRAHAGFAPEPPSASAGAPSSKDPTGFDAEEAPTAIVRAELERRERRRVEEALERTGGNQKEAATLLGISRRTFMKRLDRYALARPRKRRDDGDGDG